VHLLQQLLHQRTPRAADELSDDGLSSDKAAFTNELVISFVGCKNLQSGWKISSVPQHGEHDSVRSRRRDAAQPRMPLQLLASEFLPRFMDEVCLMSVKG
jgi:hypothetical protein